MRNNFGYNKNEKHEEEQQIKAFLSKYFNIILNYLLTYMFNLYLGLSKLPIIDMHL